MKNNIGFICPVCKKPLVKNEKSYICENRHNFDIAKSGYVNLLTGSSRKNHGDNRLMTDSRREFLSKGYYEPLRRALCDTVQKYAAQKGNVLDCGCGGGANIRRLLKKCPQGIVKGIDYSPVSVEKSKKVNDVAIAEGRCAVLQGSVADMMFTDNWFDAVTAFETVYFWPDLPRCFREVYRVLKVGGTFLICNEANGDTDKDERWTEIIGGMTIYKDTELKAYLEQAGFHEVQIHKKKGWLCVSAQK